MAPRRRGGGDGSLKKGPWTPEEDAVLLEHVRKHGQNQWSGIQSKGLLPRTGKSCRLRYVNKLRPDLKTGPFSEDEQNTVFKMQREHGNRWAMIAKELDGRTDNDVKNFWSTHQKRLKRNLRELPPPQETAPDIGQSSSQAPQHATNQLRADVAPFPAPGVLRLRAPVGFTVHSAVERGSSSAAPFDVKGKGPVSGTMPKTRHVGQSSSSSSRAPHAASQFPGLLRLPGLVELPVHAAAAERGSSSNAAATFGVNKADNSVSGFVNAASPLAIVPAPALFGQGVNPLAMVPAPSPADPFFSQGVNGRELCANGADVQPLDMQLPDPLAMVPADPFLGQGAVNGWELCVDGADVQPLAMQLPDTFGLDDGKYGLLRREARFDHLIMPEDLPFFEPPPSPTQP